MRVSQYSPDPVRACGGPGVELNQHPGAQEIRQDEPPRDEQPVLVVSRKRADTIPLLRELLQGDPEIEIIVDRRVADRRGAGPEADQQRSEPPLERRETQRRRSSSYYVV